MNQDEVLREVWMLILFRAPRSWQRRGGCVDRFVLLRTEYGVP